MPPDRVAPSWSWGAFFSTLGWLRSRGLYRLSWAYLPFSVPVLLMVSMASSSSSDACQRAVTGGSAALGYILLTWAGLIYLLPPVLAKEVERRFPTTEKKKSSYWATTAISALVPMAAAASLSSYSSEPSRARVTMAIVSAAGHRAAVDEFHALRQRLPSAGDLPSLTLPSVPAARQVVVHPGGTIQLTAGPGPIEGRSFRYVPAARDGKLSWKFGTDDIPEACLPPSLRLGQPDRL